MLMDPHKDFYFCLATSSRGQTGQGALSIGMTFLLTDKGAISGMIVSCAMSVGATVLNCGSFAAGIFRKRSRYTLMAASQTPRSNAVEGLRCIAWCTAFANVKV